MTTTTICVCISCDFWFYKRITCEWNEPISRSLNPNTRAHTEETERDREILIARRTIISYKLSDVPLHSVDYHMFTSLCSSSLGILSDGNILVWSVDSSHCEKKIPINERCKPVSILRHQISQLHTLTQTTPRAIFHSSIAYHSMAILYTCLRKFQCRSVNGEPPQTNVFHNAKMERRQMVCQVVE